MRCLFDFTKKILSEKYLRKINPSIISLLRFFFKHLWTVCNHSEKMFLRGSLTGHRCRFIERFLSSHSATFLQGQHIDQVCCLVFYNVKNFLEIFTLHGFGQRPYCQIQNKLTRHLLGMPYSEGLLKTDCPFWRHLKVAQYTWWIKHKYGYWTYCWVFLEHKILWFYDTVFNHTILSL